MIRVAADEPFDWLAMLRYFTPRAIRGVEAVEGDRYRRVARDRTEVVVHRTAAGVAASAPPTDRAKVRRLLGLDADHPAAVAHLVGDAVVGGRVGRAPGLRVPGTWDPYETGVRAVVGQQVSVAGASTVTARLVARHGVAAGGLGAELTHAFPPPEVLVGADMDGLGLTGGRITAIRSWAGAVAAGDVVLDRSVGLDELVASIVALRGLGPWTAHYVALRAGYPDAFPVADLGLQRAAGLDQRQLAAAAEGWRPFRALAAVHLWETPP